MKKKIVALSLAVAIAAIAVVGGTLAWFSDTEEVKNVFTIGTVDIVQNEEFDEETAILLPVVGTDPTDEEDNYIEKSVSVENVGNNAAYVQTFVAVPAVLDNNGIIKLYDEGFADRGWTKTGPVATGVAIPGETLPYNVYRYRYNDVLAVGDETDPCLEYVYIDSAVDLNTYDTDGDDEVDVAYFVSPAGLEITDFNALGELNVYVATQGVQAQGFADAAAALDSAFPNHPWAE